MQVFTLKKRKYFVEAAKGYKAVNNGIVIQAALSLPAQNIADDCCCVGFTATKKLGKAHIRNRTKRRLRAVAQNILPSQALSKVNYVFIGRHNTVTLDFDYLCRKALQALVEVNRQITSSEASNAQKDNDCND